MASNVLDNHPKISKGLRANFVDWLVHVCKVLNKDDETLPFVAVNMMDRYFSKTPKLNLEPY
jgi:hypothetical protein